ncbi:MAG TPA: 3D domain-containing protein [Polyangiaceae bacterium]
MKALWLLLSAATVSCATGGSAWMNAPLETDAWQGDEPPPAPSSVDTSTAEPKNQPPPPMRSRVLGEAPRAGDDSFVPPAPPGTPSTPSATGTPSAVLNPVAAGGRVLGTFRNTYYDFPSEADFSGEAVALENGKCKTIKSVARSFYEAVCVQGSGTLSTGSTVSFAKRDCDCAPLCPRTGQHICFDELDAKAFPWGRGATGRAITPLLTVAVDTDLVPLDTPIYIPEFDGVARDPSRTSTHDGCFIAQDRGVRVKGQHIDIFTGHREITALWNNLVPSNRGVTIVLDSPRCARAVSSQ